jgi:ELWxxDGT repeat protein
LLAQRRNGGRNLAGVERRSRRRLGAGITRRWSPTGRPGRSRTAKPGRLRVERHARRAPACCSHAAASSSLHFTAGRFWWQQAQDPGLGFDDALCFSDGTVGGTGCGPRAARQRGAAPTPSPIVEIARAEHRRSLAGDDSVRGMELWRSDGTLAGTQLAAEFCMAAPGPAPVHPTGLRRASRPVALPRFSARDQAHGRELWTTDGTRGGNDAGRRSGARGRWEQSAGTPRVFDGFAVFAAYTPNRGRELLARRRQHRAERRWRGTSGRGLPAAIPRT